MAAHAVTFENLVDWLEDRLDGASRARVQAHLASGCIQCEADLAFLRCVREATRADDTIEPPVQVVVRAKAAFPVALPPRPARRKMLWGPLPIFRPGLALAALVLVALVGLYLVQPATARGREATLVALQGAVEVRQQAAATWQNASPGQRLDEGDQVRVSGGEAELRLFDGSILHLQAGAALDLGTLRSGVLGWPYRVIVQQNAGRVVYDVAHVRGARSAFRVQSPTTLVTVKGTSFTVDVESPTQTRVTVTKGKVGVTGDTIRTTLAAREGAVIPAKGPIIMLPTLTPTVSPLPSATDAEIPTRTATLPPSPTSSPSAAIDEEPAALSATTTDADGQALTTLQPDTSAPEPPERIEKPFTPRPTARSEQTAITRPSEPPEETHPAERSATPQRERTFEPTEAHPTEQLRLTVSPEGTERPEVTRPPAATTSPEPPDRPVPTWHPEATETPPRTTTPHIERSPDAQRTSEVSNTPYETRRPEPSGTARVERSPEAWRTPEVTSTLHETRPPKPTPTPWPSDTPHPTDGPHFLYDTPHPPEPSDTPRPTRSPDPTGERSSRLN